MRGIAQPWEERLLEKIDRTATCWLWTGSTNNYGYGQLKVAGKAEKAHRLSYILHTGAIPAGHMIDHRCHNPPCVNPRHLRAVTVAQNGENRKGLDASNTSGYRGVSWRKTRAKWSAIVTSKGKRHYLGLFDDVHEAGAVALAKRLELHTHNDKDRN